MNLRPLLLTTALALLLAGCRAPEPTITPVPATPAPPSTRAPPTVEPTNTAVAGHVQPPVVAGSFYPADPTQLMAMVDALLADAERLPGRPIALLAPHAGYIYSGPVAAQAFRQVEGETYEVVVVVGTNHRRAFFDQVAVYPDGAFATPLGEIPIDKGLAAELIAAHDRIVSERDVFAGEHSLEVELPFLQRTLPGRPIVPVMVGAPSWENVVALSDALVEVLDGRDALIVASSDLSHYPSYQDAVAVDGELLEAVMTMDPELARSTIERLMESGVPGLATCACGEGPLLVAMRAAAGLGANRARVIDYKNSGDTPAGDRDRVVGYAAVMFWQAAENNGEGDSRRPPAAPAALSPLAPLSPGDQSTMLVLARETLERFLTTSSFPPFSPGSDGLQQLRGVFVTLRQEGELRGCRGSLVGQLSLYLEVQRSAVSAALNDPRFPPVVADELPELHLEISVLGPLEPITDVTTIQVGTHGLLVAKGDRQGVLLPQVPIERRWDRDQFLVEVCRKAGLPDDAWRSSDLFRFTAEVLDEP